MPTISIYADNIGIQSCTCIKYHFIKLWFVFSHLWGEHFGGQTCYSNRLKSKFLQWNYNYFSHQFDYCPVSWNPQAHYSSFNTVPILVSKIYNQLKMFHISDISKFSKKSTPWNILFRHKGKTSFENVRTLKI